MGQNARLIIWIVIATVIIVATGIVIAAFRLTMTKRVRAVAGISSKIYKSPYGDIEYLIEGSGPCILISHGVTGGIDQGKGLAENYLGAGYQRVYVSRFGYLRSAFPKNASAQKQAAAYNELLDHLGIAKAFILGNSAGGTSAIHFALEYPERCRGLILLSSVVPGNTAAIPPQPIMRAVFGSNFIYWTSTTFFGGSMMKMFIPDSVLRILFDTYISNASIDDGIPFEQIGCPTLIIHAADDPAPPIAGARIIAKRVPQSTLLEFEQGGHLLIGHEEEIKSKIRQFTLAR
jgi:pimeloyl-ACP methyl ester carboxylesterase